MTTATRAGRRRQLIALISRATEELLVLERAEQRAEALRHNPTSPAPAHPRRTYPAAPPPPGSAKAIRAWAPSAGIILPRTGPIPRHVRAAYADATGGTR